jgi:hypothetical protein
MTTQPTPLPLPMAVEALRPGDIVHEAPEPLRVMSPAAGRSTGYRGIGAPRIEVHVYAQRLGDWPASEAAQHARHLSWPAGTLVRVVRP